MGLGLNDVKMVVALLETESQNAWVLEQDCNGDV
jgi:hypothetical protein